VASPDGRILPVVEAAELAHERGVPVVVDTAQSLGQFPVDVPALNCDFMVGSAHKWLLGPRGVGILWVASDQLPSFRPNPVPEMEPWTMPDAPLEPATAQRMAEKGTNNTAMVIGTGRAIEIMEEIGTDTIVVHTARLSAILREGASEIEGVNILTPMEPGRSAGITTLTFDGYGPDDLRELVGWTYSEHNATVKFQWLTAPLDLDKIGMRISVSAINSENEVRGLVEALREGTSRRR
jgi:cysteine desulfurase/selenocysteine lyase